MSGPPKKGPTKKKFESVVTEARPFDGKSWLQINTVDVT